MDKQTEKDAPLPSDGIAFDSVSQQGSEGLGKVGRGGY